MSETFIHPTAVVSERAVIGDGVKIWMSVQIREDVVIGQNCIIGRNVYIENGVTLGDNCKVQNNALLYHQAVLEDGVFIGPGVILTNDKVPRAVNPDGTLKSADDWRSGTIFIGRGASIGAGAVILTDLAIGAWAMVAAGSVVTRNVPAHALVMGAPARLVGYVCKCGYRLQAQGSNGDRVWICARDGSQYRMDEHNALAKS
ncbi:MAG: dTDP-3-amino-3,6-dideoxy-alpha-D-galactopyranose 3-N-acetyltransferase [Anaerolineae bacterium]|nr:dTDP-3-amino-3,6-dideoxy-alpha-D-galactopyranose 3-N-acetyltransferase [Anaerolineae bacterium]